MLVGVIAAVVTVFCLAWPTATGAFDRSPEVGDLGSAALAIWCRSSRPARSRPPRPACWGGPPGCRRDGGASPSRHGSYEPGTQVRVLTEILFQALMVTIRLTSAATSPGVKQAATSSYASVGT